MRVNFISINTFSTIPVIRYVMESLSQYAEISIIHCHIETQPLALKVSHKEKRIGQFKSSSHFNNQSIFFKVFKYLRIYLEIAAICFRKNQIIFSQDYQVVSFVLSNKYLLSIFKTKIVYFQFELVDYDLISEIGKKKINAIAHNLDHLNLAIFPEINRLQYFSKLTNLRDRYLIIPNTCRLPGSIHESPPYPLHVIPPNAMVIGHIGNVGPDHYLKEFLSAVDQFTRQDVYFVMIGRQSIEVDTLLDQVKNPNFIRIGEVPHAELQNIYPLIHYGLILYKGVDKNFEFCAPNKLYEYWSHGIPVICHKLKGLIPVINQSFLGKVIDFEKEELIPTLNALLNVPLPDRKPIQVYFEKHLTIDSYLLDLQTKLQFI